MYFDTILSFKRQRWLSQDSFEIWYGLLLLMCKIEVKYLCINRLDWWVTHSTKCNKITHSRCCNTQLCITATRWALVNYSFTFYYRTPCARGYSSDIHFFLEGCLVDTPSPKKRPNCAIQVTYTFFLNIILSIILPFIHFNYHSEKWLELLKWNGRVVFWLFRPLK